jgi:hypothetical protein
MTWDDYFHRPPLPMPGLPKIEVRRKVEATPKPNLEEWYYDLNDIVHQFDVRSDKDAKLLDLVTELRDDVYRFLK